MVILLAVCVLLAAGCGSGSALTVGVQSGGGSAVSQSDSGAATVAQSDDSANAATQSGGRSTDSQTGAAAQSDIDAADAKSSSGQMTPVSSEEIPEPASDTVAVPVLENLNLGSELLTERFYRSGMKECLYFYTEGIAAETETLSCGFAAWSEELQTYGVDVARAAFQTEARKQSYILTPEISEEQTDAGVQAAESGWANENDGAAGMSLPREDWQISFVENGDSFFIRVSGTGGLDGDYFMLEQMSGEPELFERYMCRADFYEYTAEELRLLRNGIYAAHGAIFSSEDLKSYFGGKIWYQGTVPMAEFSEALLSDVEKENIALLKELESESGLWIDGVDYRAQYDARTAAEYLSVLDQFGETGVHMDMRNAVDKGFYYAVPGEIRVPVTLTAAQVQELEAGAELELGPCDPAGEVMMLRKDPAGQGTYGVYQYYQKETEPEQSGLEAYLSLDLNSGLYTLWYLSDDTIMRTAYEGEIYVLKGAVRGDHVSLLWASMDHHELKIPTEANDYWNMEVWSNRLGHDGKGYLSAIYCLGD